jgi:signal transduction histidine kinase
VLGIPTHLAPRVNAWSTVRAFHAAAIGSLVAAAVLLLLHRVGDPSADVLGAVLAVVPMLVMIAVHTHVGTWRSAGAFLVVGGLCSFWFATVVQRELADVPWVASYLLSLVVVPLVLIGGSGTGTLRVVLWSVSGFAVGRAVTSIAAARAGGPDHPLVLAWVTLGFVIALVVAVSRSTARSDRIQPELLRSAREEHVTAYRAGIEAEAAAILHDTVLNHLNAIALAPAGPMDEHLARTIESDVAMLTGRSWLAGESAVADDGGAGDATAQGVLAFERMLDEQRSDGLRITVTGDPVSVARLAPPALTALTRAVGQCLANVLKHAGTDAAEVSVFDDGVACTVMVVDDGRGFDEQATAADRMGLRNSVRERIGRVGGDVQVWSTPGSGTSVMMSVPYAAVPAPAADTIAGDGRSVTGDLGQFDIGRAS